MRTTNSSYGGKTRPVHKRNQAMAGAALLAGLLLFNASVVMTQVYGVRRTTAVVSTPNRTVVASKTTVVAGRGVATTLPHGYIATLPGGYRAVTVSGARYYTVGGVYYRPQMYGGKTVYVRVNL